MQKIVVFVVISIFVVGLNEIGAWPQYNTKRFNTSRATKKCKVRRAKREVRRAKKREVRLAAKKRKTCLAAKKRKARLAFKREAICAVEREEVFTIGYERARKSLKGLLESTSGAGVGFIHLDGKCISRRNAYENIKEFLKNTQDDTETYDVCAVESVKEKLRELFQKNKYYSSGNIDEVFTPGDIFELVDELDRNFLSDSPHQTDISFAAPLPFKQLRWKTVSSQDHGAPESQPIQEDSGQSASSWKQTVWGVFSAATTLVALWQMRKFHVTRAQLAREIELK